MRNLLRFIVRYNFPLLFLVLEIIALFLIFSNNPIQQGYFSYRFNNLSSMIYNSSYNISQYIHLREANDQLLRENAHIRRSVSYSGQDSSFSKNNFTFIPAKILNNSIHKVYNYLTLDIGSDDGIEPDMGVVSPFGVVGVVKSVTPDFSRVISVLNNQLRVSVKLAKSGYFGSMNWSGGNYREINITEIPSHAEIEVGDTLLTSGYSAIFPPNEPVAIVLSSKPTSGGNFLEINAALINDFKKLAVVYIVDNEDSDEILNLEEEL